MKNRYYTPFIGLTLFLLVPMCSIGQNYAEPPDLPNSIGGITGASTFTLTVGNNTYDGNVETPQDGQDNFDIIVPAGLQIDNMTWSMTDTLSLYSGFISFNGATETIGQGGGSGTFPTTFPVTAGQYTVNVVANIAYMSDWNITFTVSSINCIDPDVPTLSVSPTTVCEGESATITIAGNLNDAIAWEVYENSCGGTAVASTSSNTVVVSPTVNTAYFIRGEGPCITPGQCGFVQLNVSPGMTLTGTSTDEMLGSDGAIDLTVSGGTAPYTYDWNNDGSGDFDDPQDLSGLSSGTYWITVMDAAGCRDSTSFFVGSQVGIAEGSGIEQVQLFPNPSDGLITIQSEVDLEGSLSVLDVSGKVVYGEQLNGLSTVGIDLSLLQAGYYFLVIESDEGRLVRRFGLR